MSSTTTGVAYIECLAAYRSQNFSAIFRIQIFYNRWKFSFILGFHELMHLIEEAKQRYLIVVTTEILERIHSSWELHSSDVIITPAVVDAVTSCLQQLVDSIPGGVENPTIRKFFSLSILSFNAGLGRKGKEGYLTKLSGGYYKGFSLKFGDLVRVHSYRWFMLRDCCIVWSESPDCSEYSGTFFIDQDFEVNQLGSYIALRNSSREVLVRANTTEETVEWFNEIQNFYFSQIPIVPSYGAEFSARKHNHAKVLIDGCEYFHGLAVALLRAQKEILIASWKIKPKLLLSRPPLPPIRLDQLLRFKAEQGVQIFILLYKEFEYIGRDNDSLRTKRHLRELSPNIHVIRHPNKYFGGSTVFSWSHHEKIVVIDRNIAFVGGTDLSFKRWDNDQYNLVDEDELLFPGLEYQQPAQEVMKPVAPTPNSGARENAPDCFDVPTKIQKRVHQKGKLGSNVHCGSPRYEEIESSLIDFDEENTAIGLKLIDKKLNELLRKGKEIKAKATNQQNQTDVKSAEIRSRYPRMAWHDAQAVISGRAVRDISNHFVQRWNHHRLSKSRHKLPQLLPSTSDFNFSICAGCRMEGIYETLEHCPRCYHELGPVNPYSLSEKSTFSPLPLDDFQFYLIDCSFTLEEPLLFDFEGDCPSIVTQSSYDSTNGEKSDSRRSNSPCIGDVIVSINELVVTHLNSYQIKRLINRIHRGECLQSSTNPNQIRINFRRYLLKSLRMKEPSSNYPSAQPATVDLNCGKTNHYEENHHLHELCRRSARMEISYNISKLFYESSFIGDTVPRLCNDSGTCAIQVLRSISAWSLGTRFTECSIIKSYIEAIRNAQFFIYIENQYVIGLVEGVQNQIVEALVERIVLAYQQQEPFQVFIILPYQTFGNFLDSTETRTMMYFQTETIRVIYRELLRRADGISVKDYINFYGLRNWDVLQDQIVSSQVYVHDKVMVVDDRVVFIGSANINDRSMLGSRDSEMVLRIEDNNVIESRLNRNACLVGSLPHSTRIKFMKRVIADSAIDLTDPLDQRFLDYWKFVATSNSICYDQIDEALSCDRCPTSTIYRQALKEYTPKRYSDPFHSAITDRIQGFLVNWPHNFLSQENLSPSLLLRAIAPIIKVWQ